MNTNPLKVLGLTLTLSCGLTAADASARTSLAIKQTESKGFLTQVKAHSLKFALSSSSLTGYLCDRVSRNSGLRCPESIHGGVSSGHGGPDELSAGLPHLRLNIILQEMQNIPVSGGGIDTLGAFQEPWATWKFSSTAADQSIPGLMEDGFGLPVPPPAETWPVGNANGLFQGIIHNGCVGTPATFDVSLNSTVYRPSNSDIMGEVDLSDEVHGWGDYVFKYTIRAEDQDGNASNFVFSGIADAFCTGQANL